MSSGTADAGKSQGVSWADYDGDGDLDLYVTNVNTPNRLFRYDSGSFSEVGAASGTADPGYGQAAVFADYDNDGDLDFFLSNYQTPSRLYRNNGDGTFTDVATAFGMAGPFPSIGAAWADYDRDGRVDLFVANLGAANRLYRNQGGSFTEVALASGVSDGGQSACPAWGDYDNDGDPDLYVTKVNQPNRLYRNDGGAFVEVASIAGVDDGGHGIAATWGDYDNDQDLDLYVANVNSANRLYRNDGGVFIDVGVSSGTADTGPARGAGWCDYDSDGDLDLFVANYGSASRLYRNVGAGAFLEVGGTAGVAGPGNFEGMAWGDYDNDGRVDLYVANENNQPNKLFHNVAAAAPLRLHLNLIGTLSNRSAIGARVRVVASGLSQIREIEGGGGYLSQNSLAAEFAFGAVATVDSLIVRWPHGGTQVVTGINLPSTLSVTEPPFADVSAASGLLSDETAQGSAWGDYDRDGDADLFVSINASSQRLYRNDGGMFTNVASALGWPAASWNGRGAAWGDYQDDGDLDLFLAAYTKNLLMRNGTANNGFVDITSAAGVSGPQTSNSVAWADYDLDGDLDVYVAQEQLYRNDGFGHFVNVVVPAGLQENGISGVGASWADYDDDGDPDLYVVYSDAANRLYRNNGNGTFTNVAVAAGVADAGDGEAAAWADYDNDGDLDLCVSNRFSSTRLYRNEGNGTFFDISATMGGLQSAWSLAWADYDNDGDQDLFVGHNSSQPSAWRRWLYANDGVRFTRIEMYPDTGNPSVVPYGAAFADYDGDGDLDFHLAGFSGPSRLLRNESVNGYGWLHVDLVGTVSNTFGVGARIWVKSGGRTQMHEVGSGSGSKAQNSLTAEFGLGFATVVDSITVRWPRGIVWDTTNVAVNQRLTFVERDPTVGVEDEIPAQFALHRAQPNPFGRSTLIRFDIACRTPASLRIYDVRGRLVRTLADGETFEPGQHRRSWDGSLDGGARAGSGVYFCELRAEGFRDVSRVVMLK